MFQLVPHSVTMRKLGYVLDPTIRGVMRTQWVPKRTPKKQKIDYEKVERVVNVLERFAKLVSGKWKVTLAKRAEFRRFRDSVLKLLECGLGRYPNWGLIMYEEDQRRKAIIDAYHARLVAMPEEQFRIYNALTIREIREHNDDPWPWMELVRKLRAKRALVHLAVAEHKQVWKEMSLKNIGVPVRLHNTQAVAKKLVVRHPRNTFSALADSDSENDLNKEEMDNLERILQG
jgi:hypothetical protein